MDGVERVQPALPPLDVERELLAELAHVLLDGVHANELGELLVHLHLGLLQLLLRQRQRVVRAVVLRVLVLLVAAAGPLGGLLLALPAILERLRARRVLDGLLAQRLERHRVLLELDGA
jgi:hypothetical protein